MFRHISVFTLKNKSEINVLVDLLNEVGKCPLIAHNHVGINFTQLPDGEKGPDFGDVVQMIDFETKENLELYPLSQEHLKLFHDEKWKK